MVGLMGSGKTTVGRLLAERLNRPLRDSDQDLQAARELTAAQVLERFGPDDLHQWEAAHLTSALRERPAPVVAAAASVIDRLECRQALVAPFVVWLGAPPEVLARRFTSGAHRPRFSEDLVALLAEQEARRGPHFAEVADLVIDVTAIGPEQVVDLVLRAQEGATGCKDVPGGAASD
jgi:shikimate kinase